MAANRWDQLISEWEPRLRKAFLDGVYRVRSQAQIDAIARALERGDVETAIRGVGIDPTSFRNLDKTIGEAFEAGGEFTARQFPAVRQAGLRTIIQFNIRNAAAERWLREYSGSLIREVVDDQRFMVRQILTAGMVDGLNPRSVALDLVGRVNPATGRREGGIIGLTSTQAQWVRNYEEELRDPASFGDALTRKLRDKRFDAAVNKAIRTGDPIPAATRDAMVRNYRNRALRYRAETIARTEAMRSLHAAQDEAVRQAIESGSIQASQVQFVWRTARDKRVRDTHWVMDGDKVRLGESFVTGSGARLRYPADPEGPAEETINCRCFRETKIDFLAGVS